MIYPTNRKVMFNLLAVRSAAIPRLQRLVTDESTPMGERLALQDQLEQEKQKAERGKFDNALRRHNLLPLVLGLLEGLHGSDAKSEYMFRLC